MATVGIVYSQQTAATYGSSAYERAEAPILGVYQALIESRTPFEMVHDRLMDSEHLAPLRTLILPNTAALSDEQCDQVRDFVARGGGLLATLETSLYDADGGRRSTFGLADVFGVDPADDRATVEGPLKNGYLWVEHGAPIAADVLMGLEDAQRLIYGGYQLQVRAHEGATFEAPPLTLVPPYPDLPMEEVYPRHPRTDIPGLYCRRYGRGRVVYIPWDLDRVFWEVLHPDHGRLLANVVRWVTDSPSPVVVSGPGVLDVTAWRSPSAITVHLVNLTNPMTMRGAFREFYPVGAQKVAVRIPEGVDVLGVRFLRYGQDADYHLSQSVLTVIVPQVIDHEVVAIDVAPSTGDGLSRLGDNRERR